MSAFDRFVIAPLSPAWALRRARNRMALKAFYEAAQPSRLRKSRTDKKSANSENQVSAVNLRVLARHLEQNMDIAKGAIDVLVDNVVGSGIQPEPQVELAGGELAADLNKRLLELHDDWIYSPDVTRQHDYYSLQRLACRSWFRDGEVFGQRLVGRVPLLDHNTIVPYSLELLEADFVPYDLTDASRGILQGIEINAWGQPRAYHFYKTHPGDHLTFASNFDTKRLPATNALHLKLATRLHQLRGVSVFASVIARLDDLKEIDESERVAARVAAAMTGYIKKGNADSFDPPSVLDADGRPALRTMEMVPGMIFDDLQPGEDVGTIASNRPNAALIPFRDSQLRSASAGIGASYSSLAKNYDGTYSAQRQELVEQYMRYRTLSGQFVFRFCQPTWDGFIDAVLASGAVEIPSNVNRETIYNCAHTVPQMPWIDPLKEGQANELAERRGYKSRIRIIRETGQNPDQVNREIQRDRKERAALGLTLAEEPAAATGDEPDDEPAPTVDRKKPARKRKP